MIEANFDSLIHFLKDELKLELKDVENEQACYLLKHQETELPVFFRLKNHLNLIQITCFLPFKIKDSALNDTARLLHLLNAELDLPGFGFDEKTKMPFYRSSFFAFDEKIEKRRLISYISSSESIVKNFFNVIIAVSQEMQSFEDVLKNSKNKPL